MPYFDTHAHLDAEEFQADRAEVIARAERAGVETIVCVGITADSSGAAVQLAETHEVLHAAVGIQPNYCAEAAEGDWDRVVAMASCSRVVALGETGLDRHWDFTPVEVQKDYFDRHLRLAQERNLPVVIHCREAEADVLPMLREAAVRGPVAGVMHAFSGERSFAEECVGLGLYVSFAGALTYRNKKFEPLRAAGAWVPEDRILIETDSPYLVPSPLRGKQKRNEPAYVVHTAEYLAGLRGWDLKHAGTVTSANARRLFRIP